MTADLYTLGVDFGTLSGRAVVVRVADGAEVGAAEHSYANGVIDRRLPDSDVLLDPLWALQDPADWVAVLQHAVPAAVAASDVSPADIVAIGTDFTACTVLPALADGTPLCQLPEFRTRPHAWPKLWKHHAAQRDADLINQVAAERGESWLARYGGKLSAEWQLAKALQLHREDPEVYAATERWIEAADWIVWQLTGSESRNRCTAGYKGVLQDGRYPQPDFLAALSPTFADFVETRVAAPIADLGSPAGRLTNAAAAWTGLRPESIVATGNVDAHVTAAACNALDDGQLLAVMGTSTCHVLNSGVLTEVPGMCGVVDGGVVAGRFGYEAGQSGVGDLFAWWIGNGVPERYTTDAGSVHEVLSDEAALQPVGAHGLLALDWMNGNRSVLVDHELSGLVVGMTLDTTAADVYRALLEATAFGTRRIIDEFEAAGLPVTEVVVAGGLAKNSLLLQIYADVTRKPLCVSASAQAPALGSAIHAAVAAGLYPDVPGAAQVMGACTAAVYRPDVERGRLYDLLYDEYRRLHDYFGRAAGNLVMRRLHQLRTAGRTR